MTKIVIKKAIPFNTAVGGTCCKDKALLIKSNTIENLKNAVKEENYEEAAILRDKIKELEGEK